MERTGYVDLDWWFDHDGGEPITHDEPIGDAMVWTAEEEDR